MIMQSQAEMAAATAVEMAAEMPVVVTPATATVTRVRIPATPRPVLPQILLTGVRLRIRSQFRQVSLKFKWDLPERPIMLG